MVLGFIAGAVVGAIFVSTIQPTSKLISDMSPFVIQGIDFTMRLVEYLGSNL